MCEMSGIQHGVVYVRDILQSKAVHPAEMGEYRQSYQPLRSYQFVMFREEHYISPTRKLRK
jgi:hypothetical protein